MLKNFLIVILWMLPWQASANFLSGNQLYELCRSDKNAATFFVIGAYDAAQDLSQNKQFICLREKVLAEQIVDLVCGKLRDYPLMRDSDASGIVEAELMLAFPCRN